ncbi:hypothetical protein O1L68_30590 [Streptomyces lydicus]|nr:hypothetical protein [Streptomyces lydicus]
MSSPSRLVEILHNKGELAPEWAPTVAAVDRAHFVPDTFEVADRTVSRSADEAEWRRMVYADLPLITQHNDGRRTAGEVTFPTCSTSMPSLMLAMAAVVRDGDTVLEVGTGTGYHAAWLAHRLGGDRTTTIETDKDLHDIARDNLTRAGLHPTRSAATAWRASPRGPPSTGSSRPARSATSPTPGWSRPYRAARSSPRGAPRSTPIRSPP